MPTIRGYLAAFTAILLAAAVTTVVAAPPKGSAAEAEKRYRACMDAVATDAQRALAEAQAWVKEGGGDPAKHCVAAAEMVLGHYAEAAETPCKPWPRRRAGDRQQSGAARFAVGAGGACLAFRRPAGAG